MLQATSDTNSVWKLFAVEALLPEFMRRSYQSRRDC